MIPAMQVRTETRIGRRRHCRGRRQVSQFGIVSRLFAVAARRRSTELDLRGSERRTGAIVTPIHGPGQSDNVPAARFSADSSGATCRITSVHGRQEIDRGDLTWAIRSKKKADGSTEIDCPTVVNRRQAGGRHERLESTRIHGGRRAGGREPMRAMAMPGTQEPRASRQARAESGAAEREDRAGLHRRRRNGHWSRQHFQELSRGRRSRRSATFTSLTSNSAAMEAGGSPAVFSDFRRVLDRKDIDAVVIATPDHWHGITTIMACQAGKDVYCEKPLAHRIQEGRAMVQAVEKYKRVSQMGNLIHAGENYHRVVEIVRSGVLGKIIKTRVWLAADRSGLGRPRGFALPPRAATTISGSAPRPSGPSTPIDSRSTGAISGIMAAAS